jgi:hypothetical protein
VQRTLTKIDANGGFTRWIFWTLRTLLVGPFWTLWTLLDDSKCPK